jgi:hypothetical protein
MKPARYSVRIGEAHCIAESVSYETLLNSIIEFALRAAIARSSDECEWEHEELRRRGLGALQIFRDKKAIWDDRATFEAERDEARREHVGKRFAAANELGDSFYARLDHDLRARWQRAGYRVPSLEHDMKRLFLELERDIASRAAAARESLLAEIVACATAAS